MPDTPTPGQICYEAYQQAYDCVIWTLPWGQLQAHFRAVWEAAAQAVLQWQAAQVPGTAGWLKAHPPPPLTDAARSALEATLEAFAEEDTPDA